MIKIKYKLALILMIVTNALFAKTELFTIEELPFIDKNIEVCYLDFTKKALSKINKEMQTVINDEEVDKILIFSLMQQLSDNLQCRFRAASISLTKVPAVVVDDKVIIYGARSIKQAYDLLERGKNG